MDDCFDLAAYLVGESENEDLCHDGLEDMLYEKWDIHYSSFCEIVSELLDLIEVGKEPLSGELYKGFANRDKCLWLLKKRVKEVKKR